MEDFREPHPAGPRWVTGALSGIQAGVLGATAVLVFMALVDSVRGEALWTFPHLLATYFYGGRALHARPGWTTVSGVALEVFASGFGGAAFGVLFSSVHSRSRLILIGIVWGIGWLYLLQVLARTFARLIPVYTSELALLAAHTVFGWILGQYCWTLRSTNFQAPDANSTSDTTPSIS